MKMTLDLPEDLVIEMKMRAVRERKKLKDVAAEVFTKGLQSSKPETELSLVELLADPSTEDREFILPVRAPESVRPVEFP